jgi:hypothetical protein
MELAMNALRSSISGGRYCPDRIRVAIALACFLVVTISAAIAGSPENRAGGGIARLFDEVAKLFQNGSDPVDVEEAEELLLACAEQNERHPEGSGSEHAFFKAVDSLFGYFDSHKLQGSDILALREWQADSFDCHDEEKTGAERALAARISRALRRVWWTVARDEGAYEPRHAILCDVLGHHPITVPGLTVSAARIQRKQRGEAVHNSDVGRVVETFLVAPENKGLWQALVKETDLLYPLRNNPAPFHASDLVDDMLTNKNDQNAFKQKLDQFIPLSEKLLKAYPDYAVPERFDDITRLRVVWNTVNAYGSEASKESYREFLLKLKDYFEKRSDSIAVKWLDQVMKKPGRPPEKYVVRLQLGEPEKKDEK